MRALLDASRRVLGEDHPDTLTSRSTLAVMLIGLGQLEEAETESRAVLERLHRVLGEEHPVTRASRRSLASAFREVGQVSDAEAIERFV
jgi:hypothetical protein